MPSVGRCTLRAFGLSRWNVGCLTTLRPYYHAVWSAHDAQSSAVRLVHCRWWRKTEGLKIGAQDVAPDELRYLAFRDRVDGQIGEKLVEQLRRREPTIARRIVILQKGDDGCPVLQQRERRLIEAFRHGELDEPRDHHLVDGF